MQQEPKSPSNPETPIINLCITLFCIAVFSVVLFGCNKRLNNASTSYSTWNAFAGNADASQYSSLDQINKSNVTQLEVAWTYSTRDNNGYFFAPLLVDNVAYVLAKINSIVAIDTSNGTEIWSHTLEDPTVKLTNRGINYWENKDRTDRVRFA